MTETEWMGCSDPAPMLRFLREQYTSERKLRLLACACCRRIWHLLPDPRSREAVEVAERFADHDASRVDLARARMRAVQAADRSGPSMASYWATSAIAGGPIWNVFAAASVLGRQTVRHSEAEYAADLAGESLRQVGLVREVIGNPFRPGKIASECLAWGGGLVPQLARGIYEDRAFDRMPILGDALEDAGCDDESVLRHCRDGCPHVIGCWVLDLILGRG